MSRPDPHSYADTDQPQTRSLRWKARVDFDTHTLDAEATLTFRAPGEGTLDLDTRDLTVHEVTTLDGERVPYTLHPPDPILGAKLSLTLPKRTVGVCVRYQTSPGATALQWLSPAQTAGGRSPFLFSQCQAIHARSVIPLQDTPRVRITWEAEVTLPSALRVLMAAAFVRRRQGASVATEAWAMPQPVPPYLFAFAIGELASREVGARSRVWAEPSVLDSAAWEFADIDKLLAAGENLFGPYDWDRFDVLVMPPSFPYGGMENPRLTFVTPTLLTGDRSQVRVIAHELAHSWTGNLVTNASAEHFWLNEGWTRYAEMRIVEATAGPDDAALQGALCRRELDKAIERFVSQGHPELTKLHTQLTGIDPDEAFSEIPYDKGYLFLRAIEDHVGRPRFDGYVRAYIAAHRFGAITTEDFVTFTNTTLPGVLEAIHASAWLDGPGVPPGAPASTSLLLDGLSRVGTQIVSADVGARWSPTEWQLYLQGLPRDLSAESLHTLDATWGLTSARNHEVLVAWLTLALESGYDPVLSRTERLLGEVGRMKYLRPLYTALVQRPAYRPVARRALENNVAGYHPIARALAQAIVEGG